MRSTLRLLAYIGLAATVTSSSCSGTSDKSRSTVTPGGEVADIATYKAVALQSSDLPGDFTRVPGAIVIEAEAKSRTKQLGKCLGVRDVSANFETAFGSDSYRKGQLGISSVATVFKSSKDVATLGKGLTSKKVGDCLSESLKAVWAEKAPKGATVTPEIKAGSPSRANELATVGGPIAMTINGQSLNIYLAVTFIQAGPALIEINGFDAGGPIDAGVYGTAVDAVSRRARAHDTTPPTRRRRS